MEWYIALGLLMFSIDIRRSSEQTKAQLKKEPWVSLLAFILFLIAWPFIIIHYDGKRLIDKFIYWLT